jgi:hypothetical protein
MVPVLGIADGLTNGMTYFGIDMGSSLPPGIAAKSRRMDPNFVNRSPPSPAALHPRNSRLLDMASLLRRSPHLLIAISP